MNKTENGCDAFDSSNSEVLDLFFRYVRTIEDTSLENHLETSWAANPTYTLKIILHGRDARNGKGERDLSLRSLRWLRQKDPDCYSMNLQQVVETYGCYMDYVKLARTEEKDSLELTLLAKRLWEDYSLKEEMWSEMSLAYKWAPREGKQYDKIARLLAKLMFPQRDRPLEFYRKFLAELTRRKRPLVETTMSKRKFDQVSYETLPSKAGTKYRKAFRRNDQERYEAFLNRVREGTHEEEEAPRVKSTGVHPHEILKGLPDETLELQWQDMVAQLRSDGSLTNCLAICDVSGSMYHGSTSPKPIEVSLALSLLLVHVNEDGPWANRVLTFESTPQWVVLDTKTSVYNHYTQLKNAQWGASTNIMAGLKLILKTAIEQNIPVDKMPHTLFVFSDMQFNQVLEGTFQQALRALYAQHGYTVPEVVYWNLDARSTRGIPVESHESGTALVSGYSGTLLKTFMENPGHFNPMDIMVRTLHPYTPILEQQ